MLPPTTLEVEQFSTLESTFELDRSERHPSGRARLVHVTADGVTRLWVHPAELLRLSFGAENLLAVLDDDGAPSVVTCGPVRRLGGRVRASA